VLFRDTADATLRGWRTLYADIAEKVTHPLRVSG
jgi:hypothetical protein